MIEYKGKKQNFLAYWFSFNVMILISAGIYVLRGHEWPSATFLIVINIMFAGFMLNKNQLITLVILEEEGLVRIEVERWFKIRETFEYPLANIEAKFEIELRAKIFSKRDVFRIYVDDDKLVEVLPSKGGWPMETLQQIIADLDKYKSRIG
jgi:hypothetical protein